MYILYSAGTDEFAYMGSIGIVSKEEATRLGLQGLSYIVQLCNEEGDMHIIIALGASCDPSLVSSAFYTTPIFPFQIACIFVYYMS